MSDENTTDPPTSDASDFAPKPVETIPSETTDTEAERSSALDIPQAPVEAPPSVTAGAKESGAPNSLQPIAKATPSASINAEKHQELRIEPRIHVRWHADAFIGGLGVYQGFVKDISLKGTHFFLDLNLQKVKSINLRIHVPPISKTSEHHFIEVTGKVIYTAYDSHESLFHIGVNFIQFNLESDRAYLHSYLQSRMAH